MDTLVRGGMGRAVGRQGDGGGCRRAKPGGRRAVGRSQLREKAWGARWLGRGKGEEGKKTEKITNRKNHQLLVGDFF